MSTHTTAAHWIEKLQLEAHVEGGYYRQTYKASFVLPKEGLPATFRGDRAVSTAIYFLLEQQQFSAMHRIASDELWHFYSGDPLIVYEIETEGRLTEHHLGNQSAGITSFQCLVKAGSWFGARVMPGGHFSLVGCTVAPGFDFADFELGDRNALLQSYPQHRNIITALTR